MAAPKKDVKEAVAGNRRMLEELEAAVPGFSGYKEKESRREADKLLRVALADELREFSDAIDEIYGDITDAKMETVYESMNGMTALLDRLVGKVETADYGYSGFFDAIKVKEAALDAVYAHDKGLFDKVDGLFLKAEEFAAPLDANDAKGVAKVAREMKSLIMDFEKAFDGREKVLFMME